MDDSRQTTALDGMGVGLFSKDEHDVLEDAEGLIQKAKGARAEKAPAAWAKAQEFLDKHRPRVKDGLPALADRYVAVGAGLMDLKDRTGALTAWNKALEVHSRHLPAYHALARAFEDAGNAPEATRYLDRAIEANPAEPRALEAKASFLLRRHENAGAAELYRKLHELNPDEMKWVAELTELDPDNSTWWLARAKIAHKLKQRADAMTWTLKAAELAPNDPLPRVYESLLTEEGGDSKAALKLAEEAVMLGPSHREANLQRARLLTTLGETDAALEAWVKMTRIAADDHKGWVEAAQLFWKKGKLEEASIHYDRA